MNMNRGERRRRTCVKLMERERMMHFLGLQAGSVYRKHRKKVRRSLGYMKSGNVSHFVSTTPRRYTRRRGRYAPGFTPPVREASHICDMEQQLKETSEYEKTEYDH